MTGYAICVIINSGHRRVPFDYALFFCVCVAGGRHQHLSRHRCALLYAALIDTGHLYRSSATGRPVLLLLGGCQGIDKDVERWAAYKRIPVRTFPVSALDWRRQGLAAGPLRNRRMIEIADQLIVFPGGRGTADVTACAHRKGIPVVEVA